MKRPQSQKSEFLEFRDNAVEKFKQAVADLQSSQEDIKHADHVLGKLNPEHQKFNFDTGEVDGPRILIEDRTVANSHAEAARVVSTETKPRKNASKAKAEAAARAVGSLAKPVKPSKASAAPSPVVAEEAAPLAAAAEATTPAKADKVGRGKAEKPVKISRSAQKAAAALVTGATSDDLELEARTLLNQYFDGQRPQDEIIAILNGLKAPTTAKTVAQHYRSIHAIDLSKNRKLEGLLTTRLQSQIAHLFKGGFVDKKMLSDASGKETMHYTLSAQGKDRAKGRVKAPKSPKAATADESSAPVAETAQPEVQTAA
jgi:hypothetical protein